VDQIDINKTPPPRAFLEKHIAADRFLDFVSTRSPVFKQRPLPTSKKEAIDLMMENPSLIKRPILIRGSKVTFGFDPEAYTASGTGHRAPANERAGGTGGAKPPGKKTS
jgi:arsenate reductase (glutaredoxin)